MKVTKNDIINVIRAMAEAQDADAVFDNGVTCADIINYCDKAIEQADARRIKDAERRAKKAAAADEMKAEIVEFLTAHIGEQITREDIFAGIEHDDDFTVAKLGAKLTALVKDGAIVKDEARIDKRAKVVYAVEMPLIEE